jgi:hypothetical protein
MVLLVFCVLLLSGFLVQCRAASETDAQSAVSEASQRIGVCYGAVANAGSAGANVSALLQILNTAGDLLSEAQLALSHGGLNSSYALALQSQQMLQGFEARAAGEQSDAAHASFVGLMVNVVGSLVATVAVPIGSVALWTRVKRRAVRVVKRTSAQVDLGEYRLTFVVVTVVVMLLVASPALSRLVVYPRTTFFSEMYLLGSDQMAEGYPYNVSSGQNYTVYLGVGDQLGYCAYYVVEVKFRNETESAPSSFGPLENRTPSGLPSLFNVTAFVADEQDWELPITFSFDYSVTGNSQVVFHSLTLNGEVLNLEGQVTAWNATENVFFGNLIFELWIYNAQATVLSYHDRFVDLKLNMTS